MKKILVTGGAGFIGSHLVEQLHQRYEVSVLDKLTYCGSLKNIDGFNCIFIHDDINNIQSLEGFDVVVNLAAETHVDNSIISSDDFIKTNVVGTWRLLEALRRSKSVKEFIHISTDEVYGDISGRKKSREVDAFNPSSPYSASKSSADLLVQSYFKTYGVPVKIIRPSNCFGIRQFPEKMIPYFVKCVKAGKPMPLFSHGKQRRCWLYVEDLCSAIDIIIKKGDSGQAYNIGGKEMENIQIAKIIKKSIGGEICHVDDRCGHDQRYCVDDSKVKGLGWAPKVTDFEAKLNEVVMGMSDIL